MIHHGASGGVGTVRQQKPAGRGLPQGRHLQRPARAPPLAQERTTRRKNHAHVFAQAAPEMLLGTRCTEKADIYRWV
jgi:hypothetical protein